MKKLILYLVPILILAACSPTYYAPSTQHVPLLTEEDEFTIGGSFIGTEDANGAALKGAYAFDSNWGLMGGLSLYFSDDAGGSSPNGNAGHFEAGAGYFTKVSDKLVFETYGLLGFGGVTNRFPHSVQNYPGTTGELKANFLSVAVQPSFGFKSKYFDAALSVRTSMINYSNIRGSLMMRNEDQDAVGSQQDYLENNKNNILFEPALTLRGGLEYLKLELQTGASINLSNRYFPQEPSWLSIGLVYRLPED